MNENDTHTGWGVKPLEVSDDFLIYEKTVWGEFDGDPASILVSVAPIICPESNQVVEGEAVDVCEHSDGNYYGILFVGGKLQHVSVRADIGIMSEDTPYVQARPVRLDGSTYAWEFFHWEEYARWELLPGQHLKPKTATAQEWLAEIEMKIIPNLDVKATDLLAERLKLQVSHRAVNPTGETPLSEDTAASNAKSEWLGSDYKKARQARKAAELRCGKADVALHRHATSTKQIFPLWSAIGRWLTQGRKATRLQAHAEKAKAWHQRVATECLVLETRVIPEAGEEWIAERTRTMLTADSEMLKQSKFLAAEKEALAIQMSEAAKLTRLLKQQSPDTLITMDQSQVDERRAQTVPVLHEENALKLQIARSNRMRP